MKLKNNIPKINDILLDKKRDLKAEEVIEILTNLTKQHDITWSDYKKATTLKNADISHGYYYLHDKKIQFLFHIKDIDKEKEHTITIKDVTRVELDYIPIVNKLSITFFNDTIVNIMVLEFNDKLKEGRNEQKY